MDYPEKNQLFKRTWIGHLDGRVFSEVHTVVCVAILHGLMGDDGLYYWKATLQNTKSPQTYSVITEYWPVMAGPYKDAPHVPGDPHTEFVIYEPINPQDNARSNTE
jgi:hypothetical protein